MTKTLDILKVEQPIGIFYVAVMKSEELYKLSSADIIKISNENENVPYEGIQRPLKKEKIHSIVKYLSSKSATFPNSIIVNLNPSYRKSLNEKTMVIEENEKVFSILDGQHRLEGLHAAKKNIDVVVSIFNGIDFDLQNEVFDTINSEQTKINRSITIYKQSLSSLDTPRKFASQLSLSFTLDENSVWYRKIKLMGAKDELSEEGIISLQSFYRPIINFVYNDSDFFDVRNQLEKKQNSVEQLTHEVNINQYIFWPYYKEHNEKTIYKILNNYFNAVKEKLSKDFEESSSIIQKTTGYNALMKLFKDLYTEGYSNGDLSHDFFKGRLKGIEKYNGTINSKNYAASGDKSANDLYLLFKEAINI